MGGPRRLRPEVKGRRSRTGSTLIIETGSSQMFAKAKLVDTVDRVQPDRPRQRETGIAESTPATSGTGSRQLELGDLNCSNRPVRTRMPGGVGGVRSAMIGPYTD